MLPRTAEDRHHQGDDCAARPASLCLTRDELSELTGRRTRPAMIKTLHQMGLAFRVGGDGWPRVDRGYYAQTMRGETMRTKRRAEPRYEALKRATV